MKAKRAFTLIELIFVIAILLVLIAVSLPNLRKNFNNLQLANFSREMRAFMIYLHDRAVVERKIIILSLDTDKNEYTANVAGEEKILKKYAIPSGINISANADKILFYPDGRIDNIDIQISCSDNQSIRLISKGLYGKVKLRPEQE